MRAGKTRIDIVHAKNGITSGTSALRCCGIRVKSKGFVEPTGASRSEIIINNIDYSMNRAGLNTVVIDKETGDVADSINVNTYSDPSLTINR